MSSPCPSIGAAQAEARARLAAAGVETAALDARLLVAAALGCEPGALLTRRHLPLDPADAARLEAMLLRRLAGAPMAHILGQREFWSLTLRVSADTLVPRPDSETLIEAALARVATRPGGRHAAWRILDLGTGSGCLLLALLSELPHASGLGVDRSPAALAVARDNATALQLDGRARFVCADWGDALAGRFDLVVSNPPYVSDAEWSRLATGVRDFEPALALRGGADGCDAYRRIFADLGRLLADDGTAWIEIGGESAATVPAIAAAAGLEPYESGTDLAGRPRCIGLRRGDPLRRKKFLGNQTVPV